MPVPDVTPTSRPMTPAPSEPELTRIGQLVPITNETVALEGPDGSETIIWEAFPLVEKIGDFEEIELVLPNSNQTLSFRASFVGEGGWFGESNDDGGGTANFFEIPETGAFAGSITDIARARAYHISASVNGTLYITATNPEAFDFEEDDAVLDDQSTCPSGSPSRTLSTERKLQTASEIDIMMFYTKEAMCGEWNSGITTYLPPTALAMVLCKLSDEAADIWKLQIEARIRLGIFQTNRAFENSGVNARLNLIHVDLYPDPSFVEGVKPLRTILKELRAQFYVKRLRNCLNADLVGLIVERAQTKGLGKIYGTAHVLNSANNDGIESQAFSVTNRFWSTTSYYLAHELGHNMVSNPFHGVIVLSIKTNTTDDF